MANQVDLKICKYWWIKARIARSGKARLHLQITMAGMQLSTKAIQSPALPLQCINHIHGSYSLPLGMLSVGDSITDDIFQENLQYTKALTY